jgi:hypothetical protein
MVPIWSHFIMGSHKIFAFNARARYKNESLCKNTYASMIANKCLTQKNQARHP